MAGAAGAGRVSVTPRRDYAAAAAAVLTGAGHVGQVPGLPEPAADIFPEVDRAIADGELDVDPADLTKLLGHPPTPLETAVRDVLGA